MSKKRNKNKKDKAVDAAVHAGTGGVVGAGTAAVVGGMGLTVGGGAVAIGMAPVAAAGAVAGLAVYGIKRIFK